MIVLVEPPRCSRADTVVDAGGVEPQIMAPRPRQTCTIVPCRVHDSGIHDRVVFRSAPVPLLEPDNEGGVETLGLAVHEVPARNSSAQPATSGGQTEVDNCRRTTVGVVRVRMALTERIFVDLPVFAIACGVDGRRRACVPVCNKI